MQRVSAGKRERYFVLFVGANKGNEGFGGFENVIHVSEDNLLHFLGEFRDFLVAFVPFVFEGLNVDLFNPGTRK